MTDGGVPAYNEHRRPDALKVGQRAGVARKDTPVYALPPVRVDQVTQLAEGPAVASCLVKAHNPDLTTENSRHQPTWTHSPTAAHARSVTQHGLWTLTVSTGRSWLPWLTVDCSDPDSPIGVFDSGVGGLTVARSILDQLPH